MQTFLRKIVSLVASSLDGEVEKPGFGSWVFHRLTENCSTQTGRLISTNGRYLFFFFFPLTHGVQLDYFILMKTMAVRDHHALILVVKGWSRYVHSSTAKERLEAHVELFAAEMYASKWIF